ncbi:MAG: hypothetical protein P8J79_07115 [Halioglobus sp.]|nr:hypothetical protein [Halioglobus sp.]
MIERAVPFDYKHFLLQASADIDGKVVIDSGSNGSHGLDAIALSDYFDAPVVIASDVGHYPLRKKIFRLSAALNKGDVLILPLEWDYYSRPKYLATRFVESVANKNLRLAHYITDLPWVEKLRFILTEYPFRNVFESIFISRQSDPKHIWSKRRLDKFEQRLLLANNESFGGTQRDGPEDINFFSAFAKSCDHYLFERDGQILMHVSPTFRENIELLKILVGRGVSVYLTWPAVVDSPQSRCYSEPRISRQLERYVNDIKMTVEHAGLQMLGNFRDNHLPVQCFLNTYYHVRWSCASLRTGALIASLKADNVGPLNTGYDVADFQIEVVEALNKRRRELSKD